MLFTFTDRPNPHFTYSCNPDSKNFSDKQPALRYQDNFINCSFAPTINFSNAINWDYGGQLLAPNLPKYTHNTSGLMIHNFTKDNQGIYKCFIGHGDPLIATIHVILVCKWLLTIPTLSLGSW